MNWSHTVVASACLLRDRSCPEERSPGTGFRGSRVPSLHFSTKAWSSEPVTVFPGDHPAALTLMVPPFNLKGPWASSQPVCEALTAVWHITRAVSLPLSLVTFFHTFPLRLSQAWIINAVPPKTTRRSQSVPSAQKASDGW